MEQEIKRLKELIKETNPLSADYSTLLDHLSRAYSIAFNYEDMAPRYKWTTAKVDEPKVEIKPAEEVKETEPTPMAEPVQEPVVEEKVETPTTITKEYVRALLSDASKNGVQIQPIVAKFVPEGKPCKFSEIPAKCYAELVEDIKNAG